jgi:hypothetical protein
MKMGINGSNAINGLTELHNEKDLESKYSEEQLKKFEAMYDSVADLYLDEAGAGDYSGSESDIIVNDFLTQNN